jgi:hypothetical protein
MPLQAVPAWPDGRRIEGHHAHPRGRRPDVHLGGFRHVHLDLTRRQRMGGPDLHNPGDPNADMPSGLTIGIGW